MAEKKFLKKKKGSRSLTITFYTVYVVMIAAILAGLFWADHHLEGWLADYEASQASVSRDAILKAHFADPDWEKLYDMAGLSDTEYEDSDAFITFMRSRVGADTIHCQEDPDWTLEGRRYWLMVENETIGYFTMLDQADEDALLRDWELGNITLYSAYDQAVTIRKPEDATVFVNGTALINDHTIRISTVAADAFLPLGIHSPRFHTQYLDGLMVTPQITAVDANGRELVVQYDEASGIYNVLQEVPEITEEQRQFAGDTIVSYALGMIGQISQEELGQYFAAIPDELSANSWMAAENVTAFRWSDPEITDYQAYDEDHFSVRAGIRLTVTDENASAAEFAADYSLIFERTEDGFLCIGMTGEDLLEEVRLVRLRFLVEGAEVYTNFFEETVQSLVIPLVSAPDGQVFTGWFLRTTAEDGSLVEIPVFTPDSQGIITLPEGSILEPMELHAGFENAGENGG